MKFGSQIQQKFSKKKVQNSVGSQKLEKINDSTIFQLDNNDNPLLHIFNDQSHFQCRPKNIILDEHSRKKYLFFKPIHPFSRLRLVIDLLNFLFIIYDMSEIPLKIVYKDYYQTNEQKQLNHYITIYYFFDIVMNFSTGYFIGDNIIYERKLILKNYIKLWFWIDLLATIPYQELFNLIQEYSDQSTQGNRNLFQIFRILKFLRLVRLLKIFRLKKFFQKINNLIESSIVLKGFVSFSQIMIFNLFLAHILSCAFFFSTREIFTKDGQVNFQSKITWVAEQDIQDSDWMTKYLNGFYWAIVTMITIGYGDIVPITQNEIIFTIFSILLGSIVFGFSQDKIGQLFTQIERANKKFSNEVEKIDIYLQKHKVPRILRGKIKKYHEFNYNQKSKDIKVLAVLKILPQYLYKKISKFCNLVKKISRQFINENKFHSHGIFSLEILYMLGQHLNERQLINFRQCSPYEKIFKEYNTKEQNFLNQSEKNILFLHDSRPIFRIFKTQTIFQNVRQQNVILQFKIKLVGVLEFLTNEQYSYTLQFDEYIQILYLKYSSFIDIINQSNFKKDYQFCQQIKQTHNVNDNQKHFTEGCYICGSLFHVFKNCPRSHYVPNILKIFNLYNRQVQTQKQTFKRKNKTIRYEIDLLNKNKYTVYKGYSIPTVRKTINIDSDSKHDEIDSLPFSIDAILSLSNPKSRKLINQLQIFLLQHDKITINIDIDVFYSYQTFFPDDNILIIVEQINQLLQKIQIEKQNLQIDKLQIDEIQSDNQSQIIQKNQQNKDIKKQFFRKSTIISK